LVLVVGTVHDKATLPVPEPDADATWMLKADSEADWLPSLTLIWMFENVPT